MKLIKMIEKKLGLKVNMTKTKVTKPSNLKYLGFGFWKDREEWMAKQSVGFGDHYQAVAKTKGLHLINKEILAKQGLLSCVGYYLG